MVLLPIPLKDFGHTLNVAYLVCIILSVGSTFKGTLMNRYIGGIQEKLPNQKDSVTCSKSLFAYVPMWM